MDRGIWGRKESDITEVTEHAHIHTHLNIHKYMYYILPLAGSVVVISILIWGGYS